MQDRLNAIEQRYEQIERLLADPEVSSDHARVQELARGQAGIRGVVALARDYRRVLAELEGMQALARDGGDSEMAALVREETDGLRERKDRLERDIRLALAPRDPNDEKGVVMEIRAGTGGDEAGLFAADLFRMYTRYAQQQGWQLDVVDANRTGLGAVKEIIFRVMGDGAYSRLKHESGVHRVQRIPVTESGGRIHTSAATVAVLPEAEDVDVDIRPDDLQIDIYHASGHGGQNVQKVATAVRITHKPTGITAVCQDERSQFKNKEKAMAVLRARVLDQEVRRQEQEVGAARRSQIGTGDRSERVRTYNYPQNRITDHRTGQTLYNLDTVLEGGVEPFIEGLMAQEEEQRLRQADL